MAEKEGFDFVSMISRTISFRKRITQDDENNLLSGTENRPIHPRDGISGRRHRRKLASLLEENTAADTMTLRRDELGELPKAEILRTAEEHGWTYHDENITDNAWNLLFRRHTPESTP